MLERRWRFAWSMAFSFMTATMLSGMRSAESVSAQAQSVVMSTPSSSSTPVAKMAKGAELQGKEAYAIQKHLQKAMYTS